MTYSGEELADVAALLGDDLTFNPYWLHDKTVTPVSVGTQLDAALSRRVTAGSRAVGASHVVCAELAGTGAPVIRAIQLPVWADRADIGPPSLLWTPRRDGAVLFPEPGYVLVAGTATFMSAAVGEGVDAARARFGRQARALADRHPSLTVTAASYPPAHSAWSHPAEVDPQSSAARQLALLNDFAQANLPAPDFAHGWWEARRASQAKGERVQGPLAELFDQVFMTLEDYSVDPDLAEPGDLSDAELRAAVDDIWTAFNRAENA
ncbi:hypothetical protein JK361_34485 [Streptomyces sp. 5-8]|uniref:Colicin D immunity protein domain-containing protein n=1 Tax=Streptomyces musisoli TaxID=2802280 RepID=A0ABS1PCM5_9ACTN|nr:hypothetical protein [Streptomyces musisoli]MBL1109631.1 hypothetical protein [Streptomyces musisoli]